LGVCSESIVIIIVILLILITEDIITITEGIHAVRRETKRAGAGCLNNFSASISGASCRG
jgi:Sec-independent protein translocase protein TatA